MNYSEMTDFEINCEVLVSIEPVVEHMQLSADQKSFFHCGYDGNGFYETAIPDYCNSWADAGPIIQRNHIDLESLFEFTNESEEEITPTGIWSARGVIEGHVHPRFEHANPLRAAMIVFLMMQEGE